MLGVHTVCLPLLPSEHVVNTRFGVNDLLPLSCPVLSCPCPVLSFSFLDLLYLLSLSWFLDRHIERLNVNYQY